MIAQIPSGAFEIPQYALWMIAGWLLTSLLSLWGGYRWGLKSQREIAKRESRIAVLAELDRVMLAVGSAHWLPKILNDSRSDLERLVFTFAARVPRSMSRIHDAWKPYGALSDFDVRPEHYRNKAGDTDLAAMRAVMLTPLSRIKEEIDRA